MFIKRIVDHLLNQVLVEGLANSKWFQRFAVWSHGKVKELNAQGAATADQHVSKFFDAAKDSAAKFRKEFAEEMQKLKDAEKAGGGKRS